MNIDDIMIGDFLTFKEDNTAFIKIDGIINHNTVYGFINNANATDELDVEDLTPIPITSSILNKNDFVDK